MTKREYDKRIMTWVTKAYGALARSLLEASCFGSAAPKYDPKTDTYHVTVQVDNHRSSNKALRILQDRGIIWSYSDFEVHEPYGYYSYSFRSIHKPKKGWVCDIYRSKFERLAPRLGSKPSEKHFLRHLDKAKTTNDLFTPISFMGDKEFIYAWFHRDDYEFKAIEKKSAQYGSTYKSKCFIPKYATRKFDKAIFDEKFNTFFQSEGLWLLDHLCGVEVHWHRLSDVENLNSNRLLNDIQRLRTDLEKTKAQLKDTIRAYKAVEAYGGIDKLAKDGYDQRLEALIRQAPLHAGDTEDNRKLRELSKMTLLQKHKGE